ncbi:kdel endoplasmic reticulum proteinretention receptor 2 [Cyclospora cayetanensis]|uniref:Kdel endoplasmic reticulum proteinretention receptor 2 n=1 Tax=Cyclospora cayetanensis TaxID=88456 RepID=A0A1D3CRW1_9EIME|nr:kdel endoplasmic reticulum proteinretention receptor 2 [Cyclospora cayetanensis]
MLHVTLRWLALITLAVLFILQQVFEPLVTIWVALGEFFHCVSFILLLDLLITNKGYKGLSIKTQLCFLLVYWFRYLDNFFTDHPNHWIKVLKLFYMMSSLTLVVSIYWLRHTWERRKDSCSLPVLFVLSVLFGTINFILDTQQPGSTLEHSLQYFWIVSHYLQGFAMLPQFIFCYRDPENRDSLLTAYILVLGTYRLFYALNWIERKYTNNFFYISGPMGLGILAVFLADFIAYKIRKKSCISSLVLRLDDSMQVSRLPLLSGFGEEYERVDPGRAGASSGPTVISVGRISPMELDTRSVQVFGRPRGPSLYDEPPEPYVAPPLPSLPHPSAAASDAVLDPLDKQTGDCTASSTPAAHELELKSAPNCLAGIQLAHQLMNKGVRHFFDDKNADLTERLLQKVSASYNSTGRHTVGANWVTTPPPKKAVGKSITENQKGDLGAMATTRWWQIAPAYLRSVSTLQHTRANRLAPMAVQAAPAAAAAMEA